jgi:hypothetical protein
VERYDLLVDGERDARVKGEDEVRVWLSRYREEHQQDDPAATHVQIVRVRFMGGTLVPREEFF